MTSVYHAGTLIRKTDHRESADDYQGVVWRKGRYRIAECRDGLQWLFQRQRAGFPTGAGAWDTLGYCATRNGLMRLHRAHIGGEAAAIAAFPESFRRRDERCQVGV
jgi:hypothetical protein